MKDSRVKEIIEMKRNLDLENVPPDVLKKKLRNQRMKQYYRNRIAKMTSDELAKHRARMRCYYQKYAQIRALKRKIERERTGISTRKPTKKNIAKKRESPKKVAKKWSTEMYKRKDLRIEIRERLMKEFDFNNPSRTRQERNELAKKIFELETIKISKLRGKEPKISRRNPTNSNQNLASSTSSAPDGIPDDLRILDTVPGTDDDGHLGKDHIHTTLKTLNNCQHSMVNIRQLKDWTISNSSYGYVLILNSHEVNKKFKGLQEVFTIQMVQDDRHVLKTVHVPKFVLQEECFSLVLSDINEVNKENSRILFIQDV